VTVIGKLDAHCARCHRLLESKMTAVIPTPGSRSVEVVHSVHLCAECHPNGSIVGCIHPPGCTICGWCGYRDDR
jgi:hypothetical protein